jgi:MFS family permease
VCYTAPMVCASRWLPARKGLVSGFIVGGFGGGACMFGLLATAVLQWTPEASADALQSDGYYSAHAAIANAVPTLFVVLGLAYFVVVTVGAWLLEDSRHLIHAHHRYPAAQDKPFVTMSDTYSKLQSGGVDDDIADGIDSRKSSPLRHGIEMASMEGTELKADSDSAMSLDFKTVGTGTGSGNCSNVVMVVHMTESTLKHATTTPSAFPCQLTAWVGLRILLTKLTGLKRPPVTVLQQD